MFNLKVKNIKFFICFLVLSLLVSCGTSTEEKVKEAVENTMKGFSYCDLDMTYKYSNMGDIFKQASEASEALIDMANEGKEVSEELEDSMKSVSSIETMEAEYISQCKADHEIGKYKYEIGEYEKLDEGLYLVKVKMYDNETEKMGDEEIKVKNFDGKWKVIFE